jgi:hypothetical protein
MMRQECEFYICSVCFQVSETPGRHHENAMIFCRQLPPGSLELKPLMDESGDLRSRAPRWFLEAVWHAAGIDPQW